MLLMGLLVQIFCCFLDYCKKLRSMDIATDYCHAIRRASTGAENADKSSRDTKVQGSNRVKGRGGEILPCDPGSELRLGRRRKRMAKTINGI